MKTIDINDLFPDASKEWTIKDVATANVTRKLFSRGLPVEEVARRQGAAAFRLLVKREMKKYKTLQ